MNKDKKKAFLNRHISSIEGHYQYKLTHFILRQVFIYNSKNLIFFQSFWYRGALVHSSVWRKVGEIHGREGKQFHA